MATGTTIGGGVGGSQYGLTITNSNKKIKDCNKDIIDDSKKGLYPFSE